MKDKRFKLTELDKAAILAECKKGELTPYRIAKNWNVSYQTVWYILNPDKLAANKAVSAKNYNTVGNTDRVRKYRLKRAIKNK